MRALEIWFKRNYHVINIEKTFAMKFHSEQMRVLLRPQIIFKNIEISYKSELRFLRIFITENLRKMG
jgi:hypothetical protein